MNLPIRPPPGPATESSDFVYFAYGSTLDFGALEAWCSEHGYRIPDLGAAKPAALAGFRLAFNVRSRFWGGTVASLVRDPEGRVEGIAIPLPGTSRDFVRHKEGVNTGLYREIDVQIVRGGEKLSAIAFVAADDRALSGEEPASPKFLDAMIRGARARGLSEGWVKALESRRA